MRVVVTFVLFFSISLVVFSQQAKQYSVRHFTVVNGLASNTVSDVMQDSDGYVWMATINGLQRFDGNSFLTFRNKRSDPKTIPTNHIITIYEDRKKNLWLIGDNNKVGIFNTKKFEFNEIKPEGKVETFYMYQHFRELPTGELLLINAIGQIYKYDEIKKRLVSAETILPMPPKWKCGDISWDSLRSVYWLSCDSGLVQYKPSTKHLNYHNHNIDNDPVIKEMGDILKPAGAFSDSKGNVFFVTWPPMSGAPYVYRYDRKLNKAKDYMFGSKFGYHEIGGFVEQKNGRLWMYGNPFLAEWTGGDDPVVPVAYEYKGEQDLKFRGCFNVTQDKEKNIWLATDNGVFYFNPDEQIFNSYKLVSPNSLPKELSVTSMEELDDGRIIVSTWGEHLYCYDKNFNPLPVPKPMQGKYISVWDMAVNSRTRDLWLTLQGGGVAVYNQKTDKLIELFPDIFDQKTVRQVDEDTSGNLWFGTQGGRLIKWDLKKSGGDPTKGYEIIYQTGMIHKVHYDYQGFIWVATLGRGLLKFDAKTGRLLRTFTTQGNEGEQLFTDSPGDMTWYNDSILVVTAGCINIINTKTNKVSFISTDEGLPSNTAECIQRDKSGTLWVGLTNGICRVNLEKNIISYYDRRDGILYDKFFTAGVTHISDGRIVFFTDRDFSVFDPKRFVQQNIPPKPYITSFKLNDQYLSMDSLLKVKRVVLDYDNTSISIGFSGLSYLQQRKIHYFYMLEGVDKDWIHVDHPMEAIYNSLPPGDYIFKVKSENADGMISEEIASILIVVRPPFWETWWFLSLIGLLFILILYLIDKERVKRRESLAMVRRQIRANLKEEVSTTLNNISVLSEIAKIKADKNLVQAKEFIDQISEKSRYMDEVLEDTLWSIDPANDSMKKFILRIRELTEALKTLHEVEIDLIVDNKVQSMELDMKLRYELLFFYKDAMSFIIQNMNCDQLFVNINKTKSKLYIEILSECGSDDPNFEAKFENAVAKRVKALPATLDVLSESKSFSTVLYVNVG
jgi:ligand-binding sensor domain-containing protein